LPRIKMTILLKYCTFAAPAMPRHKGKQFLTTVPKVPAAGAGYFHPLKYAPEKFNDTTGYLRTQPLDARKRAFGSKDASRRDEFTSTVQTERYRHLLKVV
jgi:hypothetical protein